MSAFKRALRQYLVSYIFNQTEKTDSRSGNKLRQVVYTRVHFAKRC